MFRSATKLTNLLSSPLLLSKNCLKMSASMSTLISEQPMIEQDTDKVVKRPASEELVNDNSKQLKTDKVDRIKRKNHAMLLGYLGINYLGMQRNPDTNTIEEELLSALLKANLITEEAFKYSQSIHFQRAARTDKFVSAAGQIVNLKLPLNPNKDLVNEHLPKDIRVFSIKRVTKGFNSKNMCDARTYSYTIPTFAFATEEIQYETLVNTELEQRIEDYSILGGKPCYEYRISDEKLEKLSRVLEKFVGSHNFHNFTTKVKPLDPRAKRYIISFTCGKPYIENGVEFVTLDVKGQSFMMHQIRKMVGIAIGIMRESLAEDIFERCFTPDIIHLPRAPGLGLVLKTVHMDYYNKRYGQSGIHETLDWAECEEEMNDFFKNNIIRHIVDTEVKEKNMITWLAKVPFHNFENKNIEQEDEEETKGDEPADD